MLMTLRQTTPLACLLAATFLTACGDSESDENTTSETGGPSLDPQIEAVLLDAKPEGAIPVSEARKSAKAGDTVTVTGKIAGAMSPFTEGYASLVLSDRALQTCDLIPGDECPTPWDACCADPDHIKSVRLTLQVVDADGFPVAQGLKGVAGLKELTPLVATGTVAEGSTPENLIVNVTGLFPDPAP